MSDPIMMPFPDKCAVDNCDSARDPELFCERHWRYVPHEIQDDIGKYLGLAELPKDLYDGALEAVRSHITRPK